MASIDVIKEYLVSMGIQDNFTENFNKVLDSSESKMGRFANTFVGKFAIAGTAVVSAVALGNIALGKFLGNLVESDRSMDEYAKSIGKSKEEAYRLDATLRAMNVTMEEVNSNAELKANFDKLQEDAEKIQFPDMSQGLKQVREIQLEYTRFRQTATYALNWVGYYLTKYLQKPLNDIRDGAKGLNDIVIKNLPKWTSNIAKVLSWVIRLGTTLIRGSTTVYKAIKRIFDMIPKEIKLVGAALAGLGILIRAGPIGRLVMIFTGLLLLLDDFYTYLDGGDALLGDFWQKLIDIYEVLKESGVIDKFKKGISEAFEFASEKLITFRDYLVDLYNRFKESGSIEKFINLLSRILELIIAIGTPLFNIGKDLLTAFGGTGKVALEWFIDKGLPTMIDLLSGIIGAVADVIGWLNKFGGTEAIIWGVVGAFLAFKSITGVTGIFKKITESVDGLRYGFKLFTMGLRDIPGVVGKAKAAVGMFSAGANIKLIAIVGVIGLVIAAIILIYKNWDKIKEKFGEVAEWINLKIEDIKNFFIGLDNSIKERFGKIGDWFKEKAEAIVKSFSNIPSALKDKFVDAVNRIKSVFSPLVDWFKEKVDKIKGFFGGIGDKVKGIFGKGDPDDDDPKPNPVPIGHSQGGVFYNRHDAEIAEDGAEAIIPLTKPKRAREILSQIKNFIGPLGSDPSTQSGAEGIKNSLSQIVSVLSSVRNGLNEQRSINYNTNGSNVTIQNITISPQNHNKIYGSGNPETTANAINKNTINSTGLLLRNTQGVIL